MIILNYFIISGLISSLYVYSKYERMREGRAVYDMFSKKAIVVIAFVFGFYLFPVGIFIYAKVYTIALFRFIKAICAKLKSNVAEDRARRRILKKYTIEYPDGPRYDLLELTDNSIHTKCRMYSYIEKTITFREPTILYFVTDFTIIRDVDEGEYIDYNEWSMICKITRK